MIELRELERITAFLEARSPAGSARDIGAWCQARDVDAGDLRIYARGISRSTLRLISELEVAGGEEMPPGVRVEAAIAAAIVTALQVGLDAERRRRDAVELPR